MKLYLSILKISFCIIITLIVTPVAAQQHAAIADFKVIAFFTARNDADHISFVNEANEWFPKMAAQYHFQYDIR